MCARKPQIAVRITPMVGLPVIILCAESGAAQALQRAVEDNTDAQGEVLGPIHELPIIAAFTAGQAQADAAEVDAHLTVSFYRAAPASAKLVELRAVAWAEDEHGGYWKAQALWVHGPSTAEASSVSVLDPHVNPADA